MDLQNSDILGTSLLVLLTLLGIYALILKIRDHSREIPDPKLTYATWTELEKTRQHIRSLESMHKSDFEQQRRDTKDDIHKITTLLQTSTERISALTAQQEMMHQRLSELSIKTDKTIQNLNK